jgi:hypothetical protein
VPSLAVAFAALVAAGTPSNPLPIQKDGTVIHGGVAFRLPVGLLHSVVPDEQGRIFTAKRRDESAAVAVRVVLGGLEGLCEGRPGDGIDVEQARTAGGFPCCLIRTASSPDGPGMTIHVVRAGEVFVQVTAVAAEGSSAARLGRAVADSVRIVGRPVGLKRVELPRANPLMLGCFVDDRIIRVGATSGGGIHTRCFEPNFTFTERSKGWFVARSDTGGGPETDGLGVSDEVVRRGIWFLDGERLALRYDDGTEAQWEVYLTDENVLANNRLWVRE